MFCITSFERSHLLAHLVYLTQRTISYYSSEFDHYVHLTITVQDFINYMFMWFSKMHLTLKIILMHHYNLLGLLGFNHEQPYLIVEKIQNFMFKIAYKAISKYKV